MAASQTVEIVNVADLSSGDVVWNGCAFREVRDPKRVTWHVRDKPVVLRVLAAPEQKSEVQA